MSNWQFQIIKALRRKTKSSVINDQICNRRKQMNASRRAAAKNRQGAQHFCSMRSSMLFWLLWPTILCAALRENKQETQAAITDDIMFEWPPLIKTLGCQLYADRITFMSSVNEIQVPNVSVKSYIPVAVCTFVRTFSGKFVSSVLISQPLLRVFKYFSTLIFSSSVYPV